MSSSLILTAAAMPKSLEATVEGYHHFPLYLSAHFSFSWQRALLQGLSLWCPCPQVAGQRKWKMRVWY